MACLIASLIRYEIVQIECRPPSYDRLLALATTPEMTAAAIGPAALAGRALVRDLLVGLDHYLSATRASTPETDSASGESASGASVLATPPPVGILGFGLGGLLALQAVAWAPKRFSCAVCQGAPISESWLAMEMGAHTPPPLAASSADANVPRCTVRPRVLSWARQRPLRPERETPV